MVGLLFGACSTKKDTWVNRSFHSTTAKYNVLYNGQVAFDQGIQMLQDNYEDNFFEVLPIEPLKVDVIATPGMSRDTDTSPQEFEKAEEKAVKAIQKHSMLIKSSERNPQIDDAYLLLGKSRYYSKRFVPALEAFNFVIINYPNAELINETKIWQAKTEIRLRNEERAVSRMKNLLKREAILEEEIVEAGYTTLAMGYMTMPDSTQHVVNYLKKAIRTDKFAEQNARNRFILGQLYQQMNHIDSSNAAFRSILDLKKIPYKYKIQAEVALAHNTSTDEEVGLAIARLDKMVNDRDNRPYLDVLYYELGTLNEEDDSLSMAYFKKSLVEGNPTDLQREMSYEKIGDIYFDKASFVTAATYYDSILEINQTPNEKRIRRLKRKRSNLDDVIINEAIVKYTDSVLNLVSMSAEDRIALFTVYTDSLRQDALEKEKALLEQQNSQNTGFAGPTRKRNTNNGSGTFYFYNPQTVGFGVQEFRRIWGNRPNEDNWRLSNKTQIRVATSDEDIAEGGAINEPEEFKVSFYTDKIPSDKSVIDSLTIARENAYFRLGLLYKEQFNEKGLAVEKLEHLLTLQPRENIDLPSNFHLYKLFENSDQAKADYYKNALVTKYPESNFTKIVLNPGEQLSSSDDAPEKIYAEVYYLYEEELYEEVVEITTKAVAQYQGMEIVAKFELLKAYAIGKKDGQEAFSSALQFVAMSYPNSDEGKKAIELIELINSKKNNPN